MTLRKRERLKRQRDVISSRSNLFDVVSVRKFIFDADSGDVHHRLKSTSRTQTRQPRFDNVHQVYACVRTLVYIYAQTHVMSNFHRESEIVINEQYEIIFLII